MIDPREWPTDLRPIRGLVSVPQLLIGPEGAVLLDTGLPWDAWKIQRAIRRAGLSPRDLKAILLTHGHIDHAGSAGAIKRWTGAPVFAHEREQAHLDGVYPYCGASRVCGVLEAMGRAGSSYQPAQIDVTIKDGDELPFWGGLRVVHLPGHTIGHCGFYSPRHDLLFSGDVWVRFMMRTQASPRIFSDAPELRMASMRKARGIGAKWIVPGHYDFPNASRLRNRFEQLCDELERRRRPSRVI